MGKIVALQTFSNETRVFHFQDYLAYNKIDEVCIDDKELSERELEIMFYCRTDLRKNSALRFKI